MPKKPKIAVRVARKDEPEVLIPDLLKFMHETGLLWFVTQNVLHPLGISPVFRDGAWRAIDRRPRPTLVMKPEDYAEGERKFLEYMEAEGNATKARRMKLLGYVTQASASTGK